VVLLHHTAPHLAQRYDLTVAATQAENGAGGRDWIKMHKAELPNWYSTAYTIWVIKSRKVRWAENVARIGGEGKCIEFGGGI